MFKILTMNAIAAAGLDVLLKHGCKVSPAMDRPDGLLLRSADLHSVEFPKELLVIARAGASTCFELALVGKPSFFIPLPTALRNHQHFNAQSFVKAGGADEGIQESLTPRALVNYILHKMLNPEELSKKALAMHNAAIPDAAVRVADLVEQKALD